MGAEDDYQVAAPTESRTPHWHRAKIAHTRVRMEGWRQRRLGCTEKMERPKRERYLLLTWTSLLMEGLPRTLEGGRPRHPHPQGGQCRIRKAALDSGAQSPSSGLRSRRVD